VLGVLVMFGSLGLAFILPWLDTAKVRSMRYRPTARLNFFIFILACCVLGMCGAKLPDDPVIPNLKTFTLMASDLNSYVWLSRIAALYYFGYFLVILPVLGLKETPLPQPESISTPVLSHPASAPAGAAAAPETRG
jgi:ubiquinol-cytochrome c reductase cytochrome b subunit